MKQRFLSIFTVVALMASVLAGAMGVSLRYVKADSVDNTEYAVFSEIWEEITSIPYISSNYSSSQLQNFYDYVNPKVADIEENSNYVVMVMHDDNTNKWSINLYQFYNFNYISSFAMLYMEYYNGIGYPDATNGEVWLRASFYYDGVSTSSLGINMNVGSKNFSRDYTYSYNNNFGFLTTQDQAVSGRLCYSSKDIVQGAQGTWSCTKNLLYEHPTPPMIYFDLGVFWLGTRQYLSILQQDVMRDLDPEHLNDASLIVYLYNSGEGDYREFTYSDVTLLPGDWQYFVNLNFTNVSPAGLYVIDITGNEWDIITGGEIVHFDEDYEIYAISDSRIEMNEGVPGTDGTPDSYTQSFNYFSEYVNNYNQTHVIPENLADTLFGLNGSRLYPCSVSVPKSVWNSNSTGASNQLSDQHNWKWWFASRSDLGMNFELMDVVIISESATGQYSLLYYYSDTLNNPFQYVQNLSFQDLFENFDIVIIVPDDLNCLDGNTWWKDLLETICQNLGIQNLSNNLLSSLGISGSDSLGVEYVQSQPSDVAGVLQGFCIVTKKAIQRQQLYVFNDGITKTYKLMSDYIEKRGNWEDSFLTWTASLFSQWQTLDGKLGDIYNLLYGWNLSSVLSDISESLARIAANTSEEDPGYWFLSLFNWLNRFSVTDSDFANWVSEYDDFTDDLPDPGTGATVIPFPTAIPTVAVGG